MRRVGLSLILAVLTALPACKAIVDASGYEVDDEAFLTCGEGVSRPAEFQIRGCVNAIACNPGMPPYTMSECLTYDPMKGFTGKATEYRDCEDYRLRNAEAVAAADMCSDDTLRCEDNVFYNCSTGTQIDCSQRGGICRIWTNTSGLESGGCEQASLNALCTGTDTTERCSDQISYVCRDGVAIGKDCVKESALCASDGRCYFDSGTLCDTEEYGCDGDTAFECSAEGVRYERTCGERGLTCDPRVGSVCVARGCSQQDFLSCAEGCVGAGEAVVCFGGLPLTIDCKSYGYARCQQTTNPDRGLTFVRCTK